MNQKQAVFKQPGTNEQMELFFVDKKCPVPPFDC